MLEIALHNPRQHRQFRHSQGALLLARSDLEASVWTSMDQPKAFAANAYVEISLQGDGLALATKGCQTEHSSGHGSHTAENVYLSVPATFSIGDTRFEVVNAGELATIDSRSLETLIHDKTGNRDVPSSGTGPSPVTISRWFTAIGSLNRWATGMQELYAQATRCAVEAIGLDGAVLLRRRDGGWEIAASHLPHPELGIRCDLRILDALLSTPQTLFHGTVCADAGPPAVVVSPLRNAAGNLVGAVYGYRSVRAGNSRRRIRYLEAHTIEMLAGAVSDGIARLEHEAEVDRRRVLLEQALAVSPNASSRRMNSDEREVSMLFADLRGSTQLITALQMDQAYELLGDVMDCLTAAVLDHDGLVIDYYGDGLAAMWNAPADQAEHAELACRAALRMLETLPDVSADWAEIFSTSLQLAIGVHTGKALVGNAGSRRCSKYGPRGPNVHMASRVEAASKELRVPLVVTQSTASRLSNRFSTHRVCRARMRGTKHAVDLFGINVATVDESVLTAWEAYEAALLLFEQGEFDGAASRLESLDESIGSVPTRFLANEVNRALGTRQRRRNEDTRGVFDGIIAFG